MNSLKAMPMTINETAFLIELVSANKILNNKSTSGSINKLKEQAWQTVTNEFNSSIIARCHRSTTQIRLKWENLKKTARKRCANGKFTIHKTALAEVLDKVVSLLDSTTQDISMESGEDTTTETVGELPATMSKFLKENEWHDVVHFVKQVKKYPCLYNRWDEEYSNKNKQKEIWSEIAKGMRTTAVNCRYKWHKICTAYRTSLRQQQSNNLRQPYYLAKELSFLEPYIINELSSKKRCDTYKSVYTDTEDTESSVDSIENKTIDNKVCFIDVPISIKSEENASLSENTREVKKSTLDIENTNARQMFLYSLMPEIESFSDQEMRTFRRQVINTIDQIINNRERNGFK